MKCLKYLTCCLIISAITNTKSNILSEKMIICSPVANLRGAPKNIYNFTLPASSKTNPFQTTQLLFNDYVIAQQKFINQQNKTWYLVEALQQSNKNKNGSWSGLMGWIEGSDLQKVECFIEHNLVITSLFADIYNQENKKINTLFMGTSLTGKFDTEKNMCQIEMPDRSYGWIKASDVMPISKDNVPLKPKLRTNITETAKMFLGNLYSWGGRTPQTALINISSVDCSGLINLVFASQGLSIPRNSVSQYFKANDIKHGKNLQPGDLIFFGSDKHTINHVLLYIGNGEIIESSLTAGKVIQSLFKQRIGFDHTTMKSGDSSGPIKNLDSKNPTFFKVYFASFLSNNRLIDKLRLEFLQHHY
ncbi:C40 family peptidase [Candidatus Dependentiae bacterium]|nr:C40 family peptidase [Candidatus Dependentiae bacterium]